MHHHSPSSTYSPADEPMLERLEHERNTTYRYTLEFVKWAVAGVVAILFLMAVFLI